VTPARGFSVFAITLAVSVCAAGPASARVSASDLTATHEYLEARLAFNRTTASEESAGVAAIKALVAKLKGECPGVLSGAPPHVKGEKTTESERDVTEELLSAASGAAEQVEHSSDARFARTVDRLRWSNPRLTKLLRSLALERAEQSAIPTPDLCADMTFWVASDYTAVSAGTQQYLHRLMVVSSITQIELEPHEPVTNIFNLGALVAHRLRPYEDAADRALARKAIPPELKLEAALKSPAVEALLAAAGEVLAALGRTTPPAA
jgi:hypothetical protein